MAKKKAAKAGARALGPKPSERRPAGPAPVCQLKISLLGSDPPIWRRVLVPATASLAGLHRVIQVVMDWDDDHLHEFTVKGRGLGEVDPMGGGGGARAERTTTLGELAMRPGATLHYEYDFGDSWEHEIVFEAMGPAPEGTTGASCVAGERAAPPEDCGGLGGYYELLETLADPEHPDHEDMLEWAGPIDPELCDIARYNRELARLRLD